MFPFLAVLWWLQFLLKPRFLFLSAVCNVLLVQVVVFKVNTEDVFKRAQKLVQDLTEEKQCLEIQREEVSEWPL